MDINNIFHKQICVIIPVFNCVNYLRQAVESVISQPYQEIKIVLVDDGSTDGSFVLCDELANQDKRIIALHQKNGGVASARNAGLEYVLSIKDNNGDYITFLDADDVWESNWINDQIPKLMDQNYDLIGLQACTCNHLLTRRSEAAAMQEREYKGGVTSIWIHAKQCMGAMLYRVALIRQYKVRFYSIPASEDKIFSMQCLYLADRIYLVDQLMYLYRQNAMSAVHMRNRGIPYFVTIIDAYIESDIEMAQWQNDVRGELSEGKLLAKIYIMDMLEEEFEKRNGVKNIAELFEKRPDYQQVIAWPTGNTEIEQRWMYMYRHKRKIRIKNRIRCLVFGIARRIYYLPWIKVYIDKKRYPIKM